MLSSTLPAPAAGLARRTTRLSAQCRVSVVVRASGAVESAGAAFPVGSRVRVKEDVTVFHAPKAKAGMSLKGLEGVVERHADLAPDGKSLLSATQPLVVRFELAAVDGAKPVVFASHLHTHEVDAA